MGRLEGKVAVVTGGASGIGEATVRLFVAEGARVIIADVQDGYGERMAKELGPAVRFHHTDVSQDTDVRAAVERATRDFGRLDCIFNNAGFGGVVGPLEETTAEEFDATVAVLFRGVFLGIKHAAPVMKAQGSGSIISTASVAGLRAGEGPHIYSAAKAAVIHLTRSAALELGESGVRVNCICPGGIATPLVAGGSRDQAALDAAQQRMTRLQPIRRGGVAGDIARAALWLASDDASFVNGHALVVDGGMIAGAQWSQQPDIFRLHRPMMGR
ncbi:MAG TPA: glucose 1-dehydrogenase [Dehalococcoidia bacterium]|nr:glucose 1-dehydrogenase [Dehalococcoidia bacterium]